MLEIVHQRDSARIFTEPLAADEHREPCPAGCAGSFLQRVSGRFSDTDCRLNANAVP